MKVEIWADIICPWCGLGRHRLEAALERFEHRDEVEVVHRSFQLDPSAPVGTVLPVRQLLREKMGASDAQVRSMTGSIEQMAREEGLQPYIVLDNLTGSTAATHEFLAHATAQGKHAEAWELVFRAYFGEARSVFEPGDLVELGAEIGLDRTETGKALADHRYRPQVEKDAALAQSLGATGVPFFVVDERYGVAGAQSAELLLDVLTKAWDSAEPSTVEAAAPDAEGVCGP